MKNVPMRLLVVVLLAMATTVACGGDDDDVPTDPPASSATTVPAWQSCDAPKASYAVEYPPGWHTNSGDVDEPCHWFHPEPFELKPATDRPGIAVHLRMVDADLDTHVRRVTTSRASKVLHRDDRRIAERDAVVVESRTTGEGLYPAGTRTYAYFVAADGRVLAATASSVGLPRGTSYDEVKRVLDRMMASLRFLAPPMSAIEDAATERGARHVVPAP